MKQSIFYCDSPFWSRQAQLLLAEQVGASWRHDGKEMKPQNTDEPYFGLVNYSPENGWPKGKGWTFCRAPKIDHDRMGFPVRNAKAFVLKHKPAAGAIEPNLYKALIAVDIPVVISFKVEGSTINDVIPAVRAQALKMFQERLLDFHAMPHEDADNLRIVQISNLRDENDYQELGTVLLHERTPAEQVAFDAMSALMASVEFDSLSLDLRSKLRGAWHLLKDVEKLA